METKRQNKISRLIQKEVAEIFLYEGRNLFEGAMITVTRVHVTKDLSIARIYVSLFAIKDKNELLGKICLQSREIRKRLAVRIKNQVRIMPELEFFLDDSLDYIEKIEELLKK
ncbi:MAG: 30S ribosome-binding factor RbfA [Bacteroidetes bacterium]|nr:30S ribosome-binding factor RbfA [Bacteroidota bacterium]